MNPEKPKILDWLHLQREIDFAKAQWLGSIVGVLVIVFAVLLFAMGLVGLAQFFRALVGYGPFANDPTGAAIRNIGLVVAALFGAPFLVWRSIIAQKQVNVAEQGQITDRINKAVEGLGSEKTVREFIEIPRYQKDGKDWKRDVNGNPIPALRPDGKEIVDRESHERTSPNLEVRIGAIYALERIAKDSLRDHIQIMEILCAYIRENAPVSSLEPTKPPFKIPVPRIDIQAAITIIGRRNNEQIDLEWQQQFRLDLRSTDLSGVDFNGQIFSAAMFHRCRLEAAQFRESKLIGTQFVGALLNFAEFFQAELRGTRFDHAIINRPTVFPGGMGYSVNMGNIYGITVAGADITAINYLGEPNEMNLVFGSKDTILHDELEFDRYKFMQQLRKIRRLKQSGDTEQATQLEANLYEEGFVDWCPHGTEDLALGHYHNKFLDKLKLHGWPYR